MSLKNRILFSVPLIFIPIYIILHTNQLNNFINLVNLLFFYELFTNIHNNKNINNYFFLFFNIIPFINLFYFSNLIFLNNYDSKIIFLKFLTINFTSDSFQYLSGKYIKINHLDYKPFKTISPNKTLIGYIFGSMSVYLLNYFLLHVNYSLYIIFLSIIGDLFASSFKRFLKIKDFSNILQSHGGIIDRFDSIIFNLPFFYLFIQKWNNNKVWLENHLVPLYFIFLSYMVLLYYKFHCLLEKNQNVLLQYFLNIYFNFLHKYNNSSIVNKFIPFYSY